MERLIILILFAAVFAVFLTKMIQKYGIISSVSKYYIKMRWPDRRKFQVFIWIIATLFVFMSYDYSKPILYIGNISFIAEGILLLFVALFPTIKNPKHFKYHMTGAVSAITGAFVSFWVFYGIWYTIPSMVLLSALAAVLDTRRCIWWVEVLAFIHISINIACLI